MHGIVFTNKSKDEQDLEDQNLIDLNIDPSEKMTTKRNTFGPQSQNLPSIIRGYKSGVTKFARQKNPEFAWQPKYYDHIIRNEKSLKAISEYIKNNPKYWEKDTYHTPKRRVLDADKA